MDKFRVGQKVRKIKHAGAQSDVVPIGAIGTVIKLKARSRVCENFIYLWVVYDSYPALDHYLGCYAQLYRNVEPVYDGEDKSSWSECAWKPKELTKT